MIKIADRIYDRKLKCGCLISSDGGGGCIPCCYPTDDDFEEKIKLCNQVWNEWKQTKDHKLYQRHVIENNNSEEMLIELMKNEKIRKLFEETGGIIE